MGTITMPDLSRELVEPRLHKLYDYWCARRRGRRWPARRDLDPLDFSYVLGHVMLIDVLREPLRFRVRLHGTEIVTRVHYDLTGKLLDELPDSEYRAYALERCRRLVETAEPLRVVQDRELDGRIHRYEALWLPLSDDAARVTMLMCALIYQRDRAAP
jgi:hypothetical protein